MVSRTVRGRRGTGGREVAGHLRLPRVAPIAQEDEPCRDDHDRKRGASGGDVAPHIEDVRRALLVVLAVGATRLDEAMPLVEALRSRVRRERPQLQTLAAVPAWRAPGARRRRPARSSPGRRRAGRPMNPGAPGSRPARRSHPRPPTARRWAPHATRTTRGRRHRRGPAAGSHRPPPCGRAATDRRRHARRHPSLSGACRPSSGQLRTSLVGCRVVATLLTPPGRS